MSARPDPTLLDVLDVDGLREYQLGWLEPLDLLRFRRVNRVARVAGNAALEATARPRVALVGGLDYVSGILAGGAAIRGAHGAEEGGAAGGWTDLSMDGPDAPPLDSGLAALLGDPDSGESSDGGTGAEDYSEESDVSDEGSDDDEEDGLAIHELSDDGYHELSGGAAGTDVVVSLNWRTGEWEKEPPLDKPCVAPCAASTADGRRAYILDGVGGRMQRYPPDAKERPLPRRRQRADGARLVWGGNPEGGFPRGTEAQQREGALQRATRRLREEYEEVLFMLGGYYESVNDSSDEGEYDSEEPDDDEGHCAIVEAVRLRALTSHPTSDLSGCVRMGEGCPSEQPEWKEAWADEPVEWIRLNDHAMSGSGSPAAMSDMLTARTEFAACVLPNGDLIVAGGSDGMGEDYLDSAEIFARAEYTHILGCDWMMQHQGQCLSEPRCDSCERSHAAAEDRWAALPPMTRPRGYCVGCLLPDGNFGVFGGRCARAASNEHRSCDHFDFTRNAWSEAVLPPLPRELQVQAGCGSGLSVAAVGAAVVAVARQRVAMLQWLGAERGWAARWLVLAPTAPQGVQLAKGAAVMPLVAAAAE